MEKYLTLMLLSVLVLSGCAAGVGPKEQSGALLGAGTGALLGSQFGHGHGRLLAVAVGSLAGAMIGQELGRSLDQTDRQVMNQTTQQGLEHNCSQETTTWVNPDTKHSGSLTPLKTYQTAQNEYCREYLQTVVIAGEENRAYGTACRKADGSWQVIN